MNAPDLDPLINRGVLEINAAGPRPAERTIVVVGVARSGTSLFAGALHHLGVPMGNCHAPVYEDVDLAAALDARDWKELDRIVAERNAAHGVWGWKRPAFLHHARKLHAHLRHAEYVVVFRDLFAIANRNRVSVRENVIENMRTSLKEYGEILEFLRLTDARALLVSYEKALLRPDDCVAALARFAGVGSSARIAAARKFVQPEPEDYLLAARATDGTGHLDHATTRLIAGWARARDPSRPVEVEIAVNGGVLATALADLPRPDVKAAGGHPTGRCGFKLQLRGDEGVRPGDRVSVRVAGDIKDLRNSPRAVRPVAGEIVPRAPHGALDRVTSDWITGWATLPGQRRPVRVEIVANGAVLAKVPANVMRPDVKAAGLHPTGKCGFRFLLDGTEGLRPGDLIAARIAGQAVELLNSPRPLMVARASAP